MNSCAQSEDTCQLHLGARSMKAEPVSPIAFSRRQRRKLAIDQMTSPMEWCQRGIKMHEHVLP